LEGKRAPSKRLINSGRLSGRREKKVDVVSKSQDSQSNDQPSDSLLSSFIQALHDHFNPILQAIEELQRDAKKKSKK